MSREIKFRAWDSDVERFVSGGFWINATTGNLQHLPSITVIQYTGLKDKNDVEIYEWDILIHEDLFEKIFTENIAILPRVKAGGQSVQ